jgi:hypothetical protein
VWLRRILGWLSRSFDARLLDWRFPGETMMRNAGTADSIDPAVGCEGEGKICYDLSGIPDYRYKSISAKTRLGVCLPGCDLFGNDTCPLEDALGNPMGCMPAGNGTIGYCGSISPYLLMALLADHSRKALGE